MFTELAAGVKAKPVEPHKMRILVIELGHEAEGVSNLSEGLERAQSEKFDALIVDRRLPDGDGIDIVKALRAQKISTPAIFLTALNLVDDRIAGLRAGADDYLAKPFSFEELDARLEAIVRRKEPQVETVLHAGDLEMDLIARTVKRGGQEIELMPREFQLLEFMMRHAGQTVTRSMLLEGVWKFQFEPATKILDVQISRLRNKIEVGDEQPLIYTVRGAGYVLRAD